MLQKKLVFQRLELTRLETLNHSLRTQLEQQNKQRTELEYLNWTRNDRIQELELERTELGKTVLRLQEQLASKSSQLAQKNAELLKVNRVKPSNPSFICQSCDVLEKRSMDLAQSLADKTAEIERLNEALTVETHINANQAQQVSFWRP